MKIQILVPKEIGLILIIHYSYFFHYNLSLNNYLDQEDTRPTKKLLCYGCFMVLKFSHFLTMMFLHNLIF